MARVLVSDKLDEAGLEALRAAEGLQVDYRPGLDEAALAEAIGGYDALVIRSASRVTAKVLERADKLRVVGRAGIGVDNVDVEAASRRGIVVMNTPTGNAVTTAEHAISLMMALARKIPQASASMRAGKWEKTKFQGRELAGKTLGILGLGNIGRIVADRARGLKMQVIGTDPVLSSERAAALGVELVPFAQLLARADVITMHTPLTPETEGVFNDDAFAHMKPGVIIINAARGGIIDEAALERAVKSGKVGGAALDVFVDEPVSPQHPLLQLEAVVCTPHLGASTSEAQERVAIEIGEQVVAFLRDGIVQNAVNVPAVGREVVAKLTPYLLAARRLGLLLAQLEAVDVREVRVACSGEAGELGVRPIAYAALAGFLERHVDAPINPVRAPFEARERGIALVEVCEPGHRRYASSVQVTVRGGKGQHIARATLGAQGEPRLIEVEGFEVDALLEGPMMVIRNQDRPGVIGAVGTLLGGRNINVSHMQVGIEPVSREAIALWNIDAVLDEPTLAELRRLPNVRTVRCVNL